MKMIQDMVSVKIDPRPEVESKIFLPQVRDGDHAILQQEEIVQGTVIASGLGMRHAKKGGKLGAFQPNVTKPGDRVLVNLKKGLRIPHGDDHVRTFHECNILGLIEA